MTKPKVSKLLALAAPAALLFATPAFANPAQAPARAEPSPVRAERRAEGPESKHAIAFTQLAAMLRVIAHAATSAATQPMLGDDGCPLPGNVGKGPSAHDRCEMQRSVTASK